MRTRNPFVMLGLALALTGAAACDDDDGGEDVPPILGDGDGDGTPEDGTPDGSDGSDGTPDGSDGSDGTPDGSDGSDGDPDGDDGDDGCIDDPQTSLELLNNCAPEGVERRAFDNDARLPDSYVSGQPLPALD